MYRRILASIIAVICKNEAYKYGSVKMLSFNLLLMISKKNFCLALKSHDFSSLSLIQPTGNKCVSREVIFFIAANKVLCFRLCLD